MLLEGTPAWYKQQVHIFQDWLMDKIDRANTPNEESTFSEVLTKSIEMLDVVEDVSESVLEAFYLQL